MKDRESILITGTGAVAGAIARALVPAGYNVKTLGIGGGITVYNELGPNWNASPSSVLNILQGKERINPFFALNRYEIPHTVCDLADKVPEGSFRGVNTAILAAANPNSDQSFESAYKNSLIDRNTIYAAIKEGVENIVYVSSVWRTSANLNDNGLESYIKPEMDAPSNMPYAKVKASSVSYLKDLASKNPERTFSYIDHGWFPRETVGCPISNVPDHQLQWWFAEPELQQHYLLLADAKDNKFIQEEREKERNFFGFNGYSLNIPPKELEHRKFPWDLSNSRKLGVKHEFNVYDVLKNRSYDWRRIPIPSN